MKLPDELKFKETLHGHGAKGMYVYCYTDTEGHGVHVEARRESGARHETKKWSHVALVGQHFPSLDALKGALATVSDEQCAAERAKWPQVTIEPEHEGSPNRCRLCPRDPLVPAVHRITTRNSWVEQDFGHFAGLCDAHRALADDPPALIAALDAEVAERKSRRFPAMHPEGGA